MAREEDAKRAWLSRQDTPGFGTGLVAAASARIAQEESKRDWLATMDAPAWDRAATSLDNAASTATQAAEYNAGLTAACDKGDAVACDNLTKEEEAKIAWLAKLDTPTWGAAAAAVSAMAMEKGNS
jgi:transcription elongation factor